MGGVLIIDLFKFDEMVTYCYHTHHKLNTVEVAEDIMGGVLLIDLFKFD